MTYICMNHVLALSLQVAVDEFNSTIASFGDAASVSHWSEGGREWEFDCRFPPEAIMPVMSALHAAMSANPGRKVLLDRRTKRLFIR